MTVSLRLKDYHWNGTNYIPGSTLTFSPGPKSISKSVDVQWRVAHRGRRKLKKAKFRTRETITWTLQGSCVGSYTDDSLANQLEFYAKKNSKFQVVIDSSTPQIFLCPTPDGANGHTWEIVYVVFKSIKFTQTEGKIGWLDYSIELERVNCESILDPPGTGYYDPWTCISQIELRASGYTGCISTDIGKQVLDDGLVIGTLASYNNTTRKWDLIAPSVAASGSIITITSGTGAGTIV